MSIGLQAKLLVILQVRMEFLLKQDNIFGMCQWTVPLANASTNSLIIYFLIDFLAIMSAIVYFRSLINFSNQFINYTEENLRIQVFTSSFFIETTKVIPNVLIKY